MYKVFRIVILLTILTGISACNLENTEGVQTIAVNVLPLPNKALKRGGIITLSNNIWVIANVSDSVSSALATYLVKNLNKVTGEDAPITDLYSTRKHKESIKIELANTRRSKADEAYTLNITSAQITIKANSARGLYYGMQTLLQLLRSGVNNANYELPKIVIKDSPRYSIRGILTKQSQLNDLSAKHFFDLLGALKINAVFIIDDDVPEPTLKAKAVENYINLYTGSELPNDITLISYGVSGKQLEEAYSTENIGVGSKGIVLDLTSTASEDFASKLSVLAELSWTEKDKLDFLRLVKLSEHILNGK